MEPGTEVAVVWRGRRVRAWVPAPLAARDLSLVERTTRSTATAAAEVGFAAAAMPDDYAPVAGLLLRAEGVASSYLKGISAPWPTSCWLMRAVAWARRKSSKTARRWRARGRDCPA